MSLDTVMRSTSYFLPLSKEHDRHKCSEKGSAKPSPKNVVCIIIYHHLPSFTAQNLYLMLKSCKNVGSFQLLATLVIDIFVSA